MENKKSYYILKPKECYIGFEHEWICPNEDNIWRTSIIADHSELFKITSDLINDNVDFFYRVKYLDKEDIESLGFKYQKHNTFYYSIGSLFCRLETIPNSILIKLDIKPTNFNMILKIKNISELKVLLTQLGINGE